MLVCYPSMTTFFFEVVTSMAKSTKQEWFKDCTGEMKTVLLFFFEENSVTSFIKMKGKDYYLSLNGE